VKKVLEILFKHLFHFFDILFIGKKYIVFSSRSARDYADNSKVLYEEFLSKEIDNVYFYTKKRKVLKSIPKNGIYAYSFKGVYILLKSKILVFTHGSGDYFPYFPNKYSKRIFINLFHAIAVKNISTNNIKEVEKWDYFLVSSSFEAEFIKKQLGLTEQQIIILGQPRNDILIENKNKQSKSKKKKILYAPTFRDNSDVILFPFEDKNLSKLDHFLSDNNMEIVIRLHINDEKHYRNLDSYKELKNIYFSGSNIDPSVNDVLHEYDMLISDYSSIVIDYLLLNRPIAYILYDYEEYKRERDFSFDFKEHMSGYNVNSQKELESFLLNNKDDFINKRLLLKNKFHQYQDGKSAKRLFNFIRNL